MKRYYLFELGFSVVMVDNGIRYRRDRKKHKWICDVEWRRRYDDAHYEVIGIDYDIEAELILDRRKVPGFWSENYSNCCRRFICHRKKC